ncbi:MAG: DUF4350 domain-containing protein [Bacillota bacterium]
MLQEGLSGIYTVLEEQRMARRWTLPLDRLTDQIDRVVIWQAGMVEEPQRKALESWVRRGGVALVGGEMEGFAGSLGPQQGEAGFPAAAHPTNLGVEQVSVGADRFLSSEGYLVHLKDEAGSPILVSWSLGRGRIYWSADTEWLTNKRIARAQNLDLALNILVPAPGKQVAFDEYHHGFRTATRWWQLLRGELQTFVLLLAVAIALLFWAYGARFGSPRPTPPGPPRAAVEYVYSMAQLYRRAQARRVVLQALYRSLTLELGRLLGGVRGLSHAQIAERTAHRARVKPEVILSLLNRIAPDQPHLPGEAELIKLARETEELQRRMRHAGFRDQREAGKGSK